jgi:hypothetical protein
MGTKGTGYLVASLLRAQPQTLTEGNRAQLMPSSEAADSEGS